MKPFDFWTSKRSTYEGYLRTRREDWFSATRKIVQQLRGRAEILDIGSGDGHSTLQVLSLLKTNPVCHLLEPDRQALVASKERLKEFRIGKLYCNTLARFLHADKEEKFDAAFAIHTNYYWGAAKPGLGKVQSRRRYTELVCSALGLP